MRPEVCEDLFDEFFDYDLDEEFVFKYDNVLSQNGKVILDSRPAKVFENGSIPDSINLPYFDVLKEDRSFKSKEALEQLFKQKGLPDPANDPVICSC